MGPAQFPDLRAARAGSRPAVQRRQRPGRLAHLHPDLVHTCLDLLIDRESGIWHLSNGTALSWLQLAQQAAQLAGLDSRQLIAAPATALAPGVTQPRFSALGSERGTLMPPLDDALRRYLAALGELKPSMMSLGLPTGTC